VVLLEGLTDYGSFRRRRLGVVHDCMTECMEFEVFSYEASFPYDSLATCFVPLIFVLIGVTFVGETLLVR
jgi:hypothetical protein